MAGYWGTKRNEYQTRNGLSIILHGPEQDWLVGSSLLQQFSVYS